MSRATNAPASRKRRRRILKQARGFSGSRSKLLRQATEAVDRGMKLATKHRKERKRDFRSLWIVRLSAACREQGITYSRMAEGLRKAGIELNRKMLSEIAVRDPQGFATILEKVKAGLA